MRSGRIAAQIKGLFRSRFFIILLAVAVFFTVLPVTLTAMGRADIVRSGVYTVAYPFRELARLTGNAFKGFTDYFTEFDRLKEENAKLRDALAEAESKLDNAAIAEAENQWLRQFIVFATENPSYDLIDAATVARDSGELVTFFTLNKGSASGIAPGMPVISEKGLVGYVNEVGINYSKVRSIICDDTSAGAFCPRSAVYGSIEGNYSFLADGLCRFVCPDGSADIKEGDTVVTSGKGSVYPFGLPVGKVTRIEINEYTRQLTAYVEPYHSFEEMGRVMVISVNEGESQ